MFGGLGLEGTLKYVWEYRVQALASDPAGSSFLVFRGNGKDDVWSFDILSRRWTVRQGETVAVTSGGGGGDFERLFVGERFLSSTSRRRLLFSRDPTSEH